MEMTFRILAAKAPLVILAGVAIGLALPGVAEMLRPFVVPLSVMSVMVSMLRVEPARLVSTLRRPVYIAACVVLALVALPMATASLLFLAGAPVWLATGMTYASAAPPLSSAAAFAILVRADPALVTAISLPATIAAPLTVWLVTTFGPGLGEGVDLAPLVFRLFAIIAGSLTAALLLRRVAGEDRVRSWAPRLDGTTVILVTLIAIGVMHEIGAAFRTETAGLLGILALTTLLAVASLAIAILLLWPAGRDEALAAGLAASIKNMAVMVAAVLGTVEPRIALVVITAQFPIYFAPLLMRPLFQWLRGREVTP